MNTPNLTNSAIEEPQSDDDRLEEWRARLNVSTLAHNFEAFKQVPGSEKAYDVMYKLGNGQLQKKFILLYGLPGSGKTHLIEATLIAWAKQGVVARYSKMSHIMRRLKQSIGSAEDGAYEYTFKQFCEMKRLIIDDIGMGTIESRFEVADLEDIIDERYHKRYLAEPIVTIVATNKDITELPKRVTSRFYDPEFGVVIKLGTGDYRRRKL